MGFRTNAILVEPAFPGSGRELLGFFGVDANPVGTEPLVDAWHPAHLSVGNIGGCTIILDHLLVDLLLHRAPELEHQLETTLAEHQVLAVHVDDDRSSYGWVLWRHGERLRARSGSIRDGVRLDEGVMLAEERRWPVLVEPGGLRWIDEQGRPQSHARMGTRVVRSLTERLLGVPLDQHPDIGSATVERYVEQSTDSEPVLGDPVVAVEREALPGWLRRLLNR